VWGGFGRTGNGRGKKKEKERGTKERSLVKGKALGGGGENGGGGGGGGMFPCEKGLDGRSTRRPVVYCPRRVHQSGGKGR